MKRFWEIIYDDSLSQMEIIGSSTNDTLLTNNVAKMQKTGMRVRCQTPDISIPKSELEIYNYNIVTGLYSHLIKKYEEKTGEILKMW